MKILTRSLFFLLILISFSPAFAQDDNESKYQLGKNLYQQGRFTAAMDVLKPLTVEAEGNTVLYYAQYFYALSAFKAGMMQDANIMLLTLLDKNREWENIDEAYYLLGNVAFEQKKYRQAINYLEGRKKDLKDDIDKMKASYYLKINPIDTLINLQKDFPTDQTLSRVLAKRLSTTTMNEKQKMLLEYLIQEYKLDRKKFFVGKESVMKTSYNVAVLLPFMQKDFHPHAASRSNQFAFDLYEGIRFAVDSLKKKGVNINLFAYDTDKEDSKIADILKLPELASMDLIIGPIYPTSYGLVSDFALKNQILVINPLSNNSNLTSNNFTYLFQPSLQSFSGQAAKYALQNFQKDTKVKNVIIIQSPTPKDSLLANNFKDSIKVCGFEVKYHEVVNRENMRRVQDILGDSMMLLTVSHVYVASTDQVLAANIISSLEITALKIPVITGAEWLQFSLLTYDQFERREVHFMNPEFIDYNSNSSYEFRRAYLNRTNVLPTSFAYQGYEIMSLFGKALGKHGNYFVTGLQKDNFIPGTVFQGFTYANGNSNGYVPVVKFIESQLTILNNPLNPYVKEEKKKDR